MDTLGTNTKYQKVSPTPGRTAAEPVAADDADLSGNAQYGREPSLATRPAVAGGPRQQPCLTDRSDIELSGCRLGNSIVAPSDS